MLAFLVIAEIKSLFIHNLSDAYKTFLGFGVVALGLEACVLTQRLDERFTENIMSLQYNDGMN